MPPPRLGCGHLVRMNADSPHNCGIQITDNAKDLHGTSQVGEISKQDNKLTLKNAHFRFSSFKISPWMNWIFGPCGMFQGYEEDRLSGIMIFFVSISFSAHTRLPPIAPAPPVTRTVVSLNDSFKSSMGITL